MQRLLPLVTGCFPEVQLQNFADSLRATFGDESVLMTGQTLQEPDTGVSLQFRFLHARYCRKNALICHYFRLRVLSEHSIKLRRVGGK